MIVYKDYLTFNILGEEVNVISTETDYGLSTVVEINEKFHYMGPEQQNIATAIFAWQEINEKDLSSEELHQVMGDNNLL